MGEGHVPGHGLGNHFGVSSLFALIGISAISSHLPASRKVCSDVIAKCDPSSAEHLLSATSAPALQTLSIDMT